ncbi:hypothetical protein CFE70_007420 [Pyrenophora teres f. teres 0-1]|nr:hypothetical protein HRS9139_08706 [Pyrenophora teres f. teres]KAE8834693.1 hypothetical protein PTNB85_06026 [Pyrenophora teres f. teres]KAE8843828.1 hypothetical protein HRS9122_04931 [Pyrenophora teres f. teres]KAE8859113.1 hypothetical protein PTNB73_08593 [Pyrenophora teres f. teres]KAE8860979.1 hypothetical protein PTNB29_06074 [Pyrenophora teres f. teres]
MFFSKTLFTVLLAVSVANAAAVANPLDAGALDKRNCVPCGQFQCQSTACYTDPKYPEHSGCPEWAICRVRRV